MPQKKTMRVIHLTDKLKAFDNQLNYTKKAAAAFRAKKKSVKNYAPKLAGEYSGIYFLLRKKLEVLKGKILSLLVQDTDLWLIF